MQGNQFSFELAIVRVIRESTIDRFHVTSHHSGYHIRIGCHLPVNAIHIYIYSR